MFLSVKFIIFAFILYNYDKNISRLIIWQKNGNEHIFKYFKLLTFVSILKILEICNLKILWK